MGIGRILRKGESAFVAEQGIAVVFVAASGTGPYTGGFLFSSLRLGLRFSVENVALLVLVIKQAVPCLGVTVPMIGRAALRADHYIVALMKDFAANRAWNPCIVSHGVCHPSEFLSSTIIVPNFAENFNDYLMNLHRVYIYFFEKLSYNKTGELCFMK